MTEAQEAAFLDVLRVLRECDLSHKWMVIGSWSEFVYEKTGLLDSGWSFAMITRDVDLFLPGKTIGKETGEHSTSFMKRMTDMGYVPDVHRTEGFSKFFSDLLEIEFLAEMTGDGSSRSKIVHKPTGIVPEPLRYLDILRNFPMTCIVSGLEVLVPDPKAYVVQKMMVNAFRKEKREKDRLKVENLIQQMLHEDFSKVLDYLSTKELSRVLAFCESSGILLPTDCSPDPRGQQTGGLGLGC